MFQIRSVYGLLLMSLGRFFSAPHLDNWALQSGRVCLIGDFTHAIHPTGGQGAVMALEDAETLAITLAGYATPPATCHKPYGSRWITLGFASNGHDHDHVAKGLDFTSEIGNLRKSAPHFYEQAAKERLMWTMSKWTGPEAGVQWCTSTTLRVCGLPLWIDEVASIKVFCRIRCSIC